MHSNDTKAVSVSSRTTPPAVLAAATVLAASVAVLATGCGVASSPEEQVDDTFVSFEEFEATVYREPDTGIYIVDGDTPIEDRARLQVFYEQHVQAGALVVNRVGASDDRWSDAQKSSLTYCVSTTFGSNYNTVTQAMRQAAWAWQAVANVRLIHRSDQDGACSASNTNVVFDVRPTSGQLYLARAFFPSTTRANRNILIDASSFGNTSPYTLAGILRHELGHTLGFRHEHTRPEAGKCLEDNAWRALTTYDPTSVMHYPQCNGQNSGDLVLTDRDKSGAAALYGSKPAPTDAQISCVFDWAEIQYPTLFSPPAPGVLLFSAPYTYRPYPGTQSHLGAAWSSGNSIDKHIYYMGPSGTIEDQGPVGYWMEQASCP
ncbi:M57 family metalloprotease [Polyangium mundeleinium]|uniref:M57 family metalloprotease n=1 Tax=Polyangium mundeleinium TaxID=2995306 RepID=A0ABT5EVJ1_9BACT|nr:M57 family metalloprotease [Polyangium mundeleinium]MDC0745342.1 M57 family metalloprotease [Polyangium mundeleinium]